MKAEKVLVTGGNGFIARHCVLQLIDQGYPVRVTVRSEEAFQSLLLDLAACRGSDVGQLHIDHVVADLNADDRWDEAAAGIQYVLHVAAPMPTAFGTSTSTARQTARQQMARLTQCFHSAKVDKVVHVSSIAAVWYGTSDCAKPFDETSWTDTEHPVNNPYTVSKTVAEQAGWEFAGRPDSALRWTAINPVFVLGKPVGHVKGSANEIIDLLIGGKLPAIPKLGYSIVDVRDVASLIVSAMTSRASDGQRLIASTDYYSLADMVTCIERNFPNLAPHLPKLQMGDSVIRMAARVSPVLRNELINLGAERRTSSAKAREVLGWQPRDSETTIIETVRSLLEQLESK